MAKASGLIQHHHKNKERNKNVLIHVRHEREMAKKGKTGKRYNNPTAFEHEFFPESQQREAVLWEL